MYRILIGFEHAQMRKCNSLLRSNQRSLDRDILRLKQVESKTRTLIVAASKRGQKNPSQAKSAAMETRTFAKELIRVRRQQQRLATSKAQLQSVQMQVSEAFSVRQIEGSIKASASIMKDVNSLVKLPELTGTMQQLSNELMKAGIIEEMVGDMIPEVDDMEGLEDEEAESEVDKILGEVLKDRTSKVPSVPTDQLADDAEVEDTEASLEQMRGRLEALRN